MTPDKPDIDFKLDGATRDFINLVTITSWVSTYLLLSDTTEPIQGEGI